MTVTETPIADNGVNVAHLIGARDAFIETPAAAQFKWTAKNTWVNGTHSRTTVNDYFGMGGPQAHTQPHSVDTDHPELFASKDSGMTPPEMVLAGLAGCLTAGIASVATHRGIDLRSVTATVEADMDVLGLLGGDADVRNGFSGIAVTYTIDSDASPADVEALVAQSQKRSAVFDIVTNPTTVTVSVA
jgi:uncharacterized OsmC-like protein